MFNSLGIIFPMTRLGQCCFHVLKQVKNDHGKHLVRKENLPLMTNDLKLMQNFAFTGMMDLLYESLKKNTAMKLLFLINLISRTGMVCATVGSVQNLVLAFIVQTMD